MLKEEALPPSVAVMSAVHTIRLRRVTASNQTFVEWESTFSNDATQQVIQDSKFKKLEWLAALDKAAQASASSANR